MTIKVDGGENVGAEKPTDDAKIHNEAQLQQMAISIQREIDAIKTDRDVAYAERDLVLAITMKLIQYLPTKMGIKGGIRNRIPSDDPAWETESTWVAVLGLPDGQVTFPVRSASMQWFSKIPVWPDEDKSQTRLERYQRMIKYIQK